MTWEYPLPINSGNTQSNTSSLLQTLWPQTNNHIVVPRHSTIDISQVTPICTEGHLHRSRLLPQKCTIRDAGIRKQTTWYRATLSWKSDVLLQLHSGVRAASRIWAFTLCCAKPMKVTTVHDGLALYRGVYKCCERKPFLLLFLEFSIIGTKINVVNELFWDKLVFCGEAPPTGDSATGRVSHSQINERTNIFIKVRTCILYYNLYCIPQNDF